MSQPNETRNPWTTRSIETRYENPWIRVDHHDVLTPAGTVGMYGVVNFKNVAVGVVPMDANGNTWLVGQYRYPLGRYSWEICEGGGPIGADVLESAKRELHEELGMQAARWDKLFEMDLSNSVTNERAVVFVARELTMGTAHPEETEELAVRKIHLAQLYEEVCAGKHRDSMTVAAVLRLRLMHLEGTL
ncbi:MAG: NUDIX hydrolase [Deltaproteobacteria bacterium]|nr:NUDIX hydrolase [Deltaproteobacteria bacterium]